MFKSKRPLAVESATCGGSGDFSCLPFMLYVAPGLFFFFWGGGGRGAVNHRDQPESRHIHVSLREAENLVNQCLINPEGPRLFRYELLKRAYAGQGRKLWFFINGY